MSLLTIDEFFDKWKNVQGWEIENNKKQIIRYNGSPLWVIAGPGTGKTETLVMKALKLILVDGEDPGSIFLTTFTEKGSEELEDRIANYINKIGCEDEIDISDMRIGTLHGLCDNIMREYRYQNYMDLGLLDENDQEFFIRKNAEIVHWLSNKDNNYVYEYFRPLNKRISRDRGPNKLEATRMGKTLLDRCRQYRVDLNKLKESEAPLNELAEKVENYIETLREEHRTDFAQIQLHFLSFLESRFGEVFLEGDEELNKPPLKHVLVDEYQDTNPLQEEIYFKLAKKCDGDLTIVGDDDQALYRFRGGSVDCMVRFGKKCQTILNQKPEKVQLKNNYRSHKDILDWINRYIGEHKDMSENARVPGKKYLNKKSSVEGDYPGVSALLGENRKDSTKKMAKVIRFLKEEEIINDYNQVAILLRSTKESPRNAERFVDALRDENIDIYNPRNKALTEQDEIKLLLGLLIKVVDRELEVLNRDNLYGRYISDAEEWVGYFDDNKDEFEDLTKFIDNFHERLNEKGDKNRKITELNELLYKLIALEPFSSWKEEDPNIAKRISILTNLMDAYSNIYSSDLKIDRENSGYISKDWLHWQFYPDFIQYLSQSGLDEPENPYEQKPSGMVQIMTVHQAKGLEFPLVFAGDLNKIDKSDGTHFLEEEIGPYSNLSDYSTSKKQRAINDSIRRFYVQYSRAKDALILVGDKNKLEDEALGYFQDGSKLTTDYFEKENILIENEENFNIYTEIDSKPEKTDIRRRYSVTGDILSFRRCPRQYGFFSEYNYTPSKEVQLYFGKIIHRTLDRAHRQYKGQLEDFDQSIPSDEEIEMHFENINESFKARGLKPMSNKAEEKAKEYLKKFNQKMIRNGWYELVKDTEHELQMQKEDYIMEGTVDVVVRSNKNKEDPNNWEIWDYKAVSNPSKIDEDNYKLQMKVYAQLFKEKNGIYPSKAVLHYVGSSGNDEKDRLILDGEDFNKEEIERAVKSFDETVQLIKKSRENEDWSPPEDYPSDETCVACDLRWDCSSTPDKFKLEL